MECNIKTTGFKDKNDTNINEDDIIKLDYSEEYYLVSFWYEKWVLVHPPTCMSEAEGECMHDDLCSIDACNIEVVGNILENPELL